MFIGYYNAPLMFSFLFFQFGTMMFNFMCQLVWATECPDNWLNIISSMSVKVVLEEISI